MEYEEGWKGGTGIYCILVGLMFGTGKFIIRMGDRYINLMYEVYK